MFVYRPPKGNIWGHALRPRNPDKAGESLRIFFKAYFEAPPQGEPWDTFDGQGFSLSWRESVLPNVDWDPSLLLPENERFKKVLFVADTEYGGRISFPLGLLIPISPSDPASYEFLRNFCRDAPFKCKAMYFKVGIPVGKKGKMAYRKATGEIATQLESALE